MTNYLVDFINAATDAEISQYLLTNNCTVIKTFSNFDKVFLVGSETLPPEDPLVESTINDSALTISPMAVVDVVPATYDTVTLAVDDEKHWWKIYSASRLDMSMPTVEFPIHYTLDADIYVADSGIDGAHPEFIGQDISLLYSVRPGDFSDASGHGTAITSLLTGNTCSVNRSPVKIIKLFDQSYATLQSDLVAAFNAIINQVILTPSRTGILNLSWSIPRNTYIEQKIQILIDLGICVVAAAGNNGLPIEDVTPAAMKDVITVAAYNQDFTPCSFSDYGGNELVDTAGLINYGELNIWAPGTKIYVAGLGGQFVNAAGTSFAAAIVSAAIAYNTLGILSGQTRTIYLKTAEYRVPSKNGLLLLSDPKYSNSPNEVCQLDSTIDRVHAVPMPSESNTYLSVGQTATRGIINPLYMASYELLTILPSWITINDTKLVMAPTQDPADRVLEQIIILFNITPKTGDPYTQTVNVFLKGSEFDPTVYPTSDPLVTVTPLGGNGAQCNATCASDCRTGYYCTGAGPKNCSCGGY